MALYRKKNIVKKGRSVAEIILLQPFLNIFNEKSIILFNFYNLFHKKKRKMILHFKQQKNLPKFFLNPNKNKSHLSFQVNSKFKKKLHIF